MRCFTLIKELESLSSIEGFYSRDKIAWWLLKHEEEYHSQVSFFDTLSTACDSPRNLTKFSKEAQFLDLYEALSKVLEFYKEEAYYKDKLEVYDLVKNNVEQLNAWFELHKIDNSYKYNQFVSLFQNNSTISGFKLEIGYPLSLPVKVKLDESEFHYTLKFLELLERSSKIEIIGVIETINILEVIKLNQYQVYNRQSIVVYVDDFNQSKLLVRFLKGKIGLLDKLKVGQKVKVYADLTGGRNETDKQGYSLSLAGWDIKILN
ncbi:DUF3127 domain-containing protein [Formosa maritima]|uniref:DUF3127 domain-containing protein n=1 Tax=Formosa maritima TaxID=2592046 RepID=UPI00131586CF|nr:DUF3127 domain-containing protein [Formosa maritima]